MKNLLTKQENRQLMFVETLAHNDDWMILAELSSLLNCSSRILKKDIQFLNEAYDDFIIHTSVKGVSIEFNHNRGLNSFCQKLLSGSEPYQLLELVFFSKNNTVKDISDQLNISLSTLYRMIDALNKQLEANYGFYIQKGPLRIVGCEKKIRYFFYTYFYEKYHHSHWPFDEIDENKVDAIIKKFVLTKEIPTGLVYFNGFKTIIMVNYVRYKQHGFVDIDAEDAYIQLLVPNSSDDHSFYTECEETFSVPFNEEFVIQVLSQFVEKGIYYTYDHFIQASTDIPNMYDQVNTLREILNNIATENKIEFSNIETVIYVLFNSAHLEYKGPQSSYILYNHNGQFAREIYNEFPQFYKDLAEGMKQFRTAINKPMTESGIHFYIANVFSWWKDLIPELRRKIDKIRVLVISDRHETHAKMLKDFIEFEFSEQLMIDITDNTKIDVAILEKYKYELVVSSFTATKLDYIRHVYISNVPKSTDYLRIQEQIDRIVIERLNKK